MIGGVSGVGIGFCNPYTYGYNRAGQGLQAQMTQALQNTQRSGGIALVRSARRAASPETPVQPVRPAAPVSADRSAPVGLGLPIRQGADPVEMAVRMRIQYPGAQAAEEALPDQPSAAKAAAEQLIPALRAAEAKAEDAAQGEAAEGVKSAQEVMEEGECQTCKERKYQDGSDDPGVSFKTPTNIDPDQAPAAVRGHEMEHVYREQAKASREGRKVISQTVTYHTAICPECGRAYVSGGTTRTVTAAGTEAVQPQEDGQSTQPGQKEQEERTPFSAAA